MSRNKRCWVGCLVPSTGNWWEHPVDFSPWKAAPQLLLADGFPRPRFLSLLQWVSLFPDSAACSAGSMSGVCTPEDEGANGVTRCPVGPSSL